MKRVIFLLLFGITASLLSAQSQKSTIKLRTAASDLVVEGKVVECQSFWNKDHTQIFTSNLIEVSKIFKGNLTGGTFEIITKGGQVDDRFSIVSHQTTFKKGMEGMFFCKKASKETGLGKSENPVFVTGLHQNAFVQYHYEKFNPPATDESRAYQNIKKEIEDEIVLSAREPVRKLKANTVEARLEKIFKVQSEKILSPTPGIFFTFKNVSLSNNFQNLSFDVYAHASENGLQFGKAAILINYSSDVFGENIVAEDKVAVSKGTIIQDSGYSLTTTDESNEEITIDVTSSFTSLSTNAYVLTTIPEQFCHIEIEIENFFALANIGFDDFGMTNKCWHFDQRSGKYILFDRLVVENPITESLTEDPPFIYYNLDSIRVTGSGADQFLEFNLLASSNVTYTRLSVADIFISYNITAFDPLSVPSFTLDPAFDVLGYGSTVLPYYPTNIVQFTIAQDNLVDSTKHVPVGPTPKILGRVKMDIADCTENADIRFVDSLMSNLQFYFGGTPIPLLGYEIGEEGNPDVYDQFLCVSNAPIITKIYPVKLRAGVGDTLTIIGKGFKPFTDLGRGFFRDAGLTDSLLYNNAYIDDYVLYTDTLIKVYVPSSLSGSQNGAGSGKIKVENSLNKIATSDNPINIIYSITNTREPDTAYRISFINQNGIGGYTFEMDTQLETEGAGACIKKAIDAWKCLTGVNWSFKEIAEVEQTFSSDDGKSVILIGDTILPDTSGYNILMRTSLSGYIRECNNGSKKIYYIDYMDIDVNPYNSFAYDCSDIDTIGSITDFFSPLLHELGHCHMLEHNVEEDEIMHTYLIYPSLDSPSFNDVAGGKDVIDFSLNWQSIGSCASIMIHDTVSCGTNSIHEQIANTNKVLVYPNPFSNSINIKIKGADYQDFKVQIFDLTGRVLYSADIDDVQSADMVYQINPGKELPPGVYTIRISSINSTYSTIIIKG